MARTGHTLGYVTLNHWTRPVGLILPQAKTGRYATLSARFRHGSGDESLLRGRRLCRSPRSSPSGVAVPSHGVRGCGAPGCLLALHRARRVKSAIRENSCSRGASSLLEGGRVARWWRRADGGTLCLEWRLLNPGTRTSKSAEELCVA